MTLSVPWHMITNDIAKGTHSFGTNSYYSSFCLEITFKSSYFLSETPCPNWSSRKTAIRSSPCNQGFHFPWKASANTQIIQSVKEFFFAFEGNPTSISPQLPLKHNRCLPTRLPSTSCLVTTGPLLSTTKCLANSMSELNLETPLIYPPHWIDRSWLHRGNLFRVLACWITTQGPVFLILKSKSASYYKSTVPLNWGIRENISALSSGGYVLLITTIEMLQLVTDR